VSVFVIWSMMLLGVVVGFSFWDEPKLRLCSFWRSWGYTCLYSYLYSYSYSSSLLMALVQLPRSPVER
jgi:hypothetical protein